jgi:multimeric flavodoxin WrbA
MKTPLVILGSARSEGNTKEVINKLMGNKSFEFIDLNQYQINGFKYHTIQEDDFIPVINNVTQAEKIIFATPVYWYTMSYVMKIFIDRCSELLTKYKTKGKKLRNKSFYLVSTSSGQLLPEGFETPFRGFAMYFDMIFKGHLHVKYENERLASDMDKKIISFSKKIFPS